MTTKYLSFHQPEARPVPILGEVHGSLPLDGEAAAPEQFLPVSVLSEVVEQLQRPVDNVTWVKVEIAIIKAKYSSDEYEAEPHLSNLHFPERIAPPSLQSEGLASEAADKLRVTLPP